jgi:hypothetical protein
MRVLLVNPWIADVAAHNFWVRPLGLYALAEWLWERGAEPVLVDCLSPATAPGKFPRAPVDQPAALAGFPRTFARYGIAIEEFRARVRDARPFGTALLTSAMSYWYPGVQWAVEELRRSAGGIPLGLGGVYPTLWPEHARACSGADRIFCGPLEAAGAELATFLGLRAEPVRARRPWYDLGLHDGSAYGAVRTARGCPFRCSYCASERLSEGFVPRELKEVLRELSALAGHGVRDIAFYDDALLVDFEGRLSPILAEVVRQGLPLRFHTPNGLHARLVSPEVAGWLARAKFGTIRLSLETVDAGRQVETGGKVGSEEVARAVELLVGGGVPRRAIGVYLLMGLPGQDLEEVCRGIGFVRSLGVRPYLAEFSPIPGTPEWDRLVASGALPPEPDPLLTNNSVYYRLYADYDPEELDGVLRLGREPLSPN